jgi:hypothetical protein
MNLSEYDLKYVLVKDIYGETFSGLAHYAGGDFLECEYGGDKLCDKLIYEINTGDIGREGANGIRSI